MYFYDILQLDTLLELGNTNKQLHHECRNAFFSKKDIWYQYDLADWKDKLPGMVENPQQLETGFPRCLFAARQVTQLLVLAPTVSSAIDLASCEWNDKAFWDSIDIYFLSARRIIFLAESHLPAISSGFWTAALKFLERHDATKQQGEIWLGLGQASERSYFRLDIEKRHLERNSHHPNVRTAVELPLIGGSVGEFLNYLDYKEKWQVHVLEHYFNDTEAAEQWKISWEEDLSDLEYLIQYESSFVKQLLEDPMFSYRQIPKSSPIYTCLKSAFSQVVSGDCKKLSKHGRYEKMNIIQANYFFPNEVWSLVAHTYPELADNTTYFHKESDKHDMARLLTDSNSQRQRQVELIKRSIANALRS